LEAEKIVAEHEELQVRIADLQDILANRSRILEIIETEVAQLKATHATPRRTVIQQVKAKLAILT
jgi:DNA gyrase subunit A